MDSEPLLTGVVESNTTGSNLSLNDITPMDTEENINNPDNSGDTSGHHEQQMDIDINKNEGQSLDNLSMAGSESGKRLQVGDDSGNADIQADQLDASHENLATLAAVSAAGAGAEVNANSSQPIKPPAVETSTNANQSITEEANKNASHGNTNNTAPTVQTPNQPLDEEDAKWHTVGIFQSLSTTVTSFIDNTVWSSSGINLNAEDMPDLSRHARINLEPGTAYRFRIRSLNSVGASDWSEISSFKTCLPGFPGAPSAIKISKSSEGAHLTWEPPPSCVSSNEIVEYSVYLAVKPGKEKETKAGQRAPAQLAFVRVYVGAANQCTVSHTSLSAAHVDCSNKPAIIFRIAARNEKGYGPATQVRWLQDPVQNSTNNPGLGPNSLLSPTRVKPELTGASPNKRFKATVGGVGR